MRREVFWSWTWSPSPVPKEANHGRDQEENVDDSKNDCDESSLLEDVEDVNATNKEDSKESVAGVKDLWCN